MATLKYKTPEGEWKKVSIGGGGSTEEVYVGSDAPTDDNVKVWIDPNEEKIKYKDENGQWQEIAIGGGGSIDPAILEDYAPILRDFNEDFNNDFTN